MKLIVGLGNPGTRYKNTWHNLGRRTVELMAERWNVMFKPGKGEFYIADHTYQGEKVVLMIPTSYMNRSGGVVAPWLRYYKLPPEDAIIIFDDHDLLLGKIRLRLEGTSGGHRGMDDIIRLTGTDKIPRIKIGIREDENKPANLADKVLAKVPKRVSERVDLILQYAADLAEECINGDAISLMGKYNGLYIE